MSECIYPLQVFYLIALLFNRLLGDLENQVDLTESKLARAQKRMDYFLTKAEREYANRCSSKSLAAE
jgi:hypothetical protein